MAPHGCPQEVGEKNFHPPNHYIRMLDKALVGSLLVEACRSFLPSAYSELLKILPIDNSTPESKSLNHATGPALLLYQAGDRHYYRD